MGQRACDLIRWGNRPASLWISEDLGAALQADGETRFALSGLKHQQEKRRWTILLDWTYRSRRPASALWMTHEVAGVRVILPGIGISGGLRQRM